MIVVTFHDDEGVQPASGSVWWAPSSVTDIRTSTYGFVGGEATMNLTGLDPAELTSQRLTPIEVALGFGQLDIVVRAGMSVAVLADIGAGEVRRFGSGGFTDVVSEGLTIEDRLDVGRDPPAVTVDATVGLGQITVIEQEK